MGQPGLCVCPTDCIVEAQDVVITDSEGKKVCGTDGQTYPSECHMKIAACKKYQYIVVANKGDCGKHLTFSSLQYLDKTVRPYPPYARHYKPRLVYFFTPFPKTIYVL